MGKKGSFLQDNLGYMILAVLVLVIGLAAYFIISGKGTGIIDRIINLIRFWE